MLESRSLNSSVGSASPPGGPIGPSGDFAGQEVEERHLDTWLVYLRAALRPSQAIGSGAPETMGDLYQLGGVSRARRSQGLGWRDNDGRRQGPVRSATLRSLMAHTYPNIEVTVTDDRNTERSANCSSPNLSATGCRKPYIDWDGGAHAEVPPDVSGLSRLCPASDPGDSPLTPLKAGSGLRHGAHNLVARSSREPGPDGNGPARPRNHALPPDIVRNRVGIKH
jgi:hypothetical protein